MKNSELLDEILGMLGSVKDDNEALEKIHSFMVEEIYLEDKEEIDPKYKDVIIKIANELLDGSVCFLNPASLEFEEIPKSVLDDPEEYEAATGGTIEDWDLKYESWERYIKILPMNSDDSFRMMSQFPDTVADQGLKSKLENALHNRKPFANFKHLIDNSEYRQMWFDFRLKKWVEYVWGNISDEMD
jgi:hypothetical protein